MILSKKSNFLLKKTYYFIAFALLLGSLINNVSAFSEVSVDTDFFTNLGFNSATLNVEYQSDGKIVVGGNFTEYDGNVANRIVRLNSDGTIDPTFNMGAGFNSNLRALEIQSDGKIIAGGFFTDYDGNAVNAIVRLNSDGTIDPTFNMGTSFLGSPFVVIYAILEQSDGKILIGGAFTSYNGNVANRIVRLNSDGTIDPTFNMGSGFSLGLYDALYNFALQPDGKIIVLGDFTSYDGNPVNQIVRLNSDGTIDPTFNMGTSFNDTAYRIVVQDDGKIIVGGNFTEYNGSVANRIVRLNSDGTIDPTFNMGVGFNSYTRGIFIQDDGKILVVGGDFTSYNGATANGIVLLHPNGLIDTGFVSGIGAAGGAINNLTVQPDGKLLLAGSFTTYDGVVANRIVRLNHNVTLAPPIITSPVSGAIFSDSIIFIGTGISGNVIDILDGIGNFIGSGLVDASGNFSIGPVVLSGGLYTAVASNMQGSLTGSSVMLSPDQPPVLSLTGNSVINLNVGNIYQEQGASWIDDLDGSGSLDLSLGAVNTGWLLSGSVDTNTTGTYILQYRYNDTAGNSSNIVSRIIVVHPPTFGGGGGGTSLVVDHCPAGDNSSSYYDQTCEGNNTPSVDESEEPFDTVISYPDSEIYNSSIEDGYCYRKKTDVSLVDSQAISTSDEFKKALVFFLSYDMSMFDHIDDFKPNANLTREQAAKIFSKFAVNVLCRKPNTGLIPLYLDFQNINPTLIADVKQAYQLGLMKGGLDSNFRPKDIITKAEFNAVIVRMILNSYLPEDNSDRRYDEYNKVSSALGIVKGGIGSEDMIRKNATVMLFRAYKDNIFSLEGINDKNFVLASRDKFIR